jgi:TonB family protein
MPYAVAAGAVLLAGMLAGPKVLHRTPASTTRSTSTSASDPAGDVASHEPAAQPHDPASTAPKSTPAPALTKPAQPVPAPVPSSPKTAPPAKTSAAGAVADRVLPKVSQRSLNTITGKVKVTVKLAVDPNGKVSSAALQSAGPSEYFAKVALEASRHWKFDPPLADGAPVPSQWLLRYVFGRGGVEVRPEKVSH